MTATPDTPALLAAARPGSVAALEIAVVAAALAPAFLDQATTDSSAAGWLALAGYGLAAALGLAVRRRRPLAALAAVLLALVVTEVACAWAEVGLTPLAVLPLAFALYAAGAHAPPRHSALALAGGAALVAVAVVVNHATAADDWRGGSDVLAVLAPLPAAWALGLAARGRREELAAAERRAADAQREQALRAERAAAAERVRIARDMHDVAAHSLTLLVLHAETLRARSGELPDWAREGIDAVASAGRQATTEMRDMLGVLRDQTGEAAPRSPAPRLADVPRLVAAAERAGGRVRLEMGEPAAALPRPVQLAAYRLIQESLTNARRHAPGAEVEIRVGADARGARVRVDCGPPPPGHTPSPGSGVGLTGLRERIAALGGDLTAGPAPDGRFAVTATIPAAAPADPSAAASAVSPATSPAGGPVGAER
ncbi:sensor histidine kinase [Streptomyces sp. WAC 06738]|uniref:sensor histidine kinase n=1 Tax=Streptomyces sp. WAC 06738 TaxID=2203210 RepID=UPI001F0BF355|nr:sensor histidine kinase [Streptomyces sp. WAC 06738]